VLVSDDAVPFVLLSTLDELSVCCVAGSVTAVALVLLDVSLLNSVVSAYVPTAPQKNIVTAHTPNLIRFILPLIIFFPFQLPLLLFYRKKRKKTPKKINLTELLCINMPLLFFYDSSIPTVHAMISCFVTNND